MRRSLICLLITAAFSAGAYGYVRQSAESDSARPLFRTDPANIVFLVNTSLVGGFVNADGETAITKASDPLSALAAAENSWQDVRTASVHFQPLTKTTLQNDPSDGKCVMTIADTPENRSIVGDYLAVTIYTYAANGAITDTDIVFNPAIAGAPGNTIPFSTDQEWNSYDLRSVATHELGHALGADHSGIVGSTMNFATSPIGSFADAADATVQSVLSTDDAAFITQAYPAGNSGQQSGSIKGTVAFSNGSPVMGGLVVATDPSTGITVGSLTSVVDGTYLISPLPSGSYFVYVQPLDGPVFPASLGMNGSAVSASFRTSFAGGNDSPWSVGVNEGDTSTANITVDAQTPAVHITWLGVGSPQGSDWSFAAVKTAMSGQFVDILLWGPDLGNTITESELRIFGPGVSVVPGSLRSQSSAGVNGMIPVRFTVNIFPSHQRNLVSVGVVHGTDASILSGGLIELPAVTVTQSTLPDPVPRN